MYPKAANNNFCNYHREFLLFSVDSLSQFLAFLQVEVIHGLAIMKKSVAIVNKEFGLDVKLADAIVEAADEVARQFCRSVDV